jgi:hypothetical protein
VDGDRVLFTNLITDNNRIYEVSGVGVALSWEAKRVFGSDLDPEDGDSVRIQTGEAFRDQLAIYDGTDFLVNDIVRFFDGVSGDYWELGSIKTSTLADATTGTVFSVGFTGSENIVVEYSLARGSMKETGQIYITTNGTTAELANVAANIGATEVDFSAAINGSDLELNFETSALGTAATMKYFLKRWSNSAGGPAGVPSYSAAGGVPTAAAGSIGDVQIHGASGNLDADSRFKFDTAEGALNLNGLLYKVLSSPVTLNDAQASPATLLSYAVASCNFVVIEYSIKRDGAFRTGRILVANSASAVTDSDDFVELGSTGITISTTYSAGSVFVQYVSTSTGFTGEFKYTIKKWS